MSLFTEYLRSNSASGAIHFTGRRPCNLKPINHTVQIGGLIFKQMKPSRQQLNRQVRKAFSFEMFLSHFFALLLASLTVTSKPSWNQHQSHPFILLFIIRLSAHGKLYSLIEFVMHWPCCFLAIRQFSWQHRTQLSNFSYVSCFSVIILAGNIPRQTEISNFHDVVVIDENVPGRNVAMNALRIKHIKSNQSRTSQPKNVMFYWSELSYMFTVKSESNVHKQ